MFPCIILKYVPLLPRVFLNIKMKKEVEMSKPKSDSIPVSPFCQYALSTEKSAQRFMMMIAVVLGALMWYFIDVEFIAVLGWIVLAVMAYLVRPQFRRSEQMWFEMNKKDYEVSMQLEELLRTFYHYSEKDIYNAGVTEGQFDSLWTPVYAQYFSGEKGLSADISVSGKMFGVFASSGEFSGKVIGSVAPDSISDFGALLILQNEQGQSVRAVVPHRKVAEQMLSEMLCLFNKNNKGLNTLTSLQIKRMSMYLPPKACVTFVTALRVLDQIVATYGKPVAERSLIRVYGTEISPGVVMATALEIEGECGVFIPTGYIKEISDELEKFLGTYRGEVGMLIEGQGPFVSKEMQLAS